MKHPLLVASLLGAALIALLACCLGLLRMRGAAARVHYLGPAAMIPPLLITAGIWAEDPGSQGAIKATLVCVILLCESPVLAHALGRAVMRYEKDGKKNNR